MDEKQNKLLFKRLIIDPQLYNGIEPREVKENKDAIFCKNFFLEGESYDLQVTHLLEIAINSKNEDELDLLITLIEHFNITSKYDYLLCPLIVTPWHHLHDRIALILEKDANLVTAKYLFEGATYTCKNLEYQEDYKEFNRKCMFGLKNINSNESIHYLQQLSTNKDLYISKMANEILTM